MYHYSAVNAYCMNAHLRSSPSKKGQNQKKQDTYYVYMICSFIFVYFKCIYIYIDIYIYTFI